MQTYIYLASVRSIDELGKYKATNFHVAMWVCDVFHMYFLKTTKASYFSVYKLVYELIQCQTQFSWTCLLQHFYDMSVNFEELIAGLDRNIIVCLLENVSWNSE